MATLFKPKGQRLGSAAGVVRGEEPTIGRAATARAHFGCFSKLVTLEGQFRFGFPLTPAKKGSSMLRNPIFGL